MEIQHRLLKFIIRSNWILLAVTSISGILLSPPDFAKGVICGGLIVTINFHLLYRTLRKAFSQPQLASYKGILIKYYVRFFASGIVLFVLVIKLRVDPLGLVIGLSVVVASIMMATAREAIRIISKEAAQGGTSVSIFG